MNDQDWISHYSKGSIIRHSETPIEVIALFLKSPEKEVFKSFLEYVPVDPKLIGSLLVRDDESFLLWPWYMQELALINSMHSLYKALIAFQLSSKHLPHSSVIFELIKNQAIQTLSKGNT